MGKLVIEKSKLTKSFAFESENVTIKGVAQQDAESGELVAMHGTCYQSVNGTEQMVGTFKGKAEEGEMCYEYSQIPKRVMMGVLDAIDEIENKI
jgi:hypothetical protein